jgi:hypothetical protein
VDYDPTNGTTSAGEIVRISSGPIYYGDDPLVMPAINRIRNVYNVAGM